MDWDEVCRELNEMVRLGAAKFTRITQGHTTNRRTPTERDTP